ncbi:hypothetical protein Pint_31814 [Pistacia integerrima]|uniref:Uncharacterized protein n=1 Tax=Pistacia integerrima TaxID=434235 RepID=A0ACC0XPH4_9ROSI|nr:hypothetical protein Pint_31814 [Pistacia integerrima]
MSQNGKLMPNLDQQSTKLLNLTVLQRIDPFIEEILITAAHVTFYEFNIDLSQWSRKDVEGSLFVVKRNTQPRFQFVVMNRRNTDNLVENLLGDFEYEVQVPYLLYRNASQEVNGIWFYNARECEEVANLFNRILNAYVKVPQKSMVSSTKSEFEELEAVPTMAVMDGPLEPSSSTVSNAADAPDDPAFVNFFSISLYVLLYDDQEIGLWHLYLTSTAAMGRAGGWRQKHHQPRSRLKRQRRQANYLQPQARRLEDRKAVVDTAMNIGNASNATIATQPYQSSTTVPPPSNPATVASPVVPTLQIPSPPLSASVPLMPLLDPESSSSSNRIANLVKPSSFFVPPPASARMIPSVSSSIPTAPPLNPPSSLQRPYGAPLLQPFPPPTPPPPSLAPVLTPNYGAVISKDKVRDALLALVQDNQFMDMFYRALLNAHHS